MKLLMLLAAASVLAVDVLTTTSCNATLPEDPLTVITKTGVFTGLQNLNYTAVREFRNIPFAQPPVGPLRFLSPKKLRPSIKHHYSYRYPPSCPQYVSGTASFWNLYVPYLMVNNAQMNHSSGLPLLTSAEDCLSLAVWTPFGVSADAKLPVAFFMTGGGFATGGIDIPGQLPLSWVNRTQDHIVVAINYRVNIFGFPNARGGDNANVAILDQRMALEWVHENIAAFGGDPDSIMLWGQSAGSQSVDYHNYAFWDNPISKSSFSQSGTALKSLPSSDYSQSNFTFVAKNLGCDFPNDAAAELECLQQVPMAEILYWLNSYKGKPSVSFGPIADELLLFSDYAARAAAGKISPNPAIFSDCANNDASLNAFPVSDPAGGLNQTKVNSGTLLGWVCPTAHTSIIRARANLTTYRYQYAGNWSNQEPYQWLGGYHAADLVMNFGTYFYSCTNCTTSPSIVEKVTSETMQDYILTFMKDPVNGPPAMGWLPYTYGGNVLRFGADNIPVQNASGYDIDGPCYGNGSYNGFP